MRTVLVAALFFSGGCMVPEPVAAPAATPTTPTATGTALPRPPIATVTPVPPASAPASIATTAAGTIPSRFRYAAIGWGPVTRIWLVDLDGRVEPRLVVRLEQMGNGDHTSSADGAVLAVSAPGRRGHHAVHIVRPASGARTVVYDDDDAQVAWTPVVTRDGTRYAIAKQIAGASASGGDQGIWTGSTAGGPATLLVQGTGGPAPRPIAWSPDGRWLLYARGSVLSIVTPGASERRVAEGADASWLSSTTLLVARVAAAPPGIDRYDVAAGSIREETTSAAAVMQVLAEPVGGRYAYIERRSTPGAYIGVGPVWLRDAAAGPARQLDAESLRELLWSSDGSALTGILGGDDSSTGVVDLLGGRGARLCTRSDGLPPLPPGGCV